FHDIDIVQRTRLAQLYPGVLKARVNSIHHQGIKDLAPGFDVEAWSNPDRVPEAIRRRDGMNKGYIAATQWHPEFHKAGATDTLNDTAILDDFLSAARAARVKPQPAHLPGRIRDRAARLLRQALLR
ncbi:MAG: peptidase, partial [Rhodoferax sp.]|nr:peptidase [Rhodoferax sp.]